MDEGEFDPIVAALKRRHEARVDFMMRLELGLECPEPTRARNSARTIAASYIVGGVVPLVRYMIVRAARHASPISSVVTLVGGSGDWDYD